MKRERNGTKQTRWQSFVLAIACFTSGPWTEVMNMKMMVGVSHGFNLKPFAWGNNGWLCPRRDGSFRAGFVETVADLGWYGLDLWVELPKFPNVTSAHSNKLRKSGFRNLGPQTWSPCFPFWRTDYGFWHTVVWWLRHFTNFGGPKVAFCSHNWCVFS